MAGKTNTPGTATSGKPGATSARADRLKAALKANIARRKARTAVRGGASGDGPPEPDDTPRR